MGSKNTDLKMNLNSKDKSTLEDLSGQDLKVIHEIAKNESFDNQLKDTLSFLGAFISGISIVTGMQVWVMNNYTGWNPRSNYPGRAVGTCQAGFFFGESWK